MRITCVPGDSKHSLPPGADLRVVLYGQANGPSVGAVGATVRRIIRHRKLEPAERAWDLLSIALSVIAADTAERRDASPDGWTRQFDLQVSVSDPAFWATQCDLLTRQLEFLTGDIWRLSFLDGGGPPVQPNSPVRPEEDCVVLLSGGLDSLVGAVDLVKAHGKCPFAVSQVSAGDKKRQSLFASSIGAGLAHLQLNHNAVCPGTNERSQRARSILFLAYGVLAATALKRYQGGEDVTLYACENGFMSINPPLTTSRLGSLSTRTTHPYFLRLFQELLNKAGLFVRLENPYQFSTKGELLSSCADQTFLRKLAHVSTSCGRFARYGFRHCGRCFPCLIRRAAIHAWGVRDQTDYKFTKLSQDDSNHARYDDVRSAAIAVAAAKADGIMAWAGSSLSTALLGETSGYADVVKRGVRELADFLDVTGIK